MKGSISAAVLRVDVQAPLDEQFTIAKRTIIKSAMMEVELMSSPTAPYSTAKGYRNRTGEGRITGQAKNLVFNRQDGANFLR